VNTLIDQISEDSFPNLYQFFARFGEDWRDEFVSLVEDIEGTLEPEKYVFRRVVSTYIVQASAKEVVCTTQELEKLLDMQLSAEQLQLVASQVFHCYSSLGSAESYEQWLKAIRGQLSIVRPHHLR
jgi:hypothetical protein